jgi:hypothetical protein
MCPFSLVGKGHVGSPHVGSPHVGGAREKFFVNDQTFYPGQRFLYSQTQKQKKQ